MMQRTGAAGLTRRVLIVDNEVAESTNAAARSVRALTAELRARSIEVIEANSYEDGVATITSDSGIHCILLDWTTGRNDKAAHAQATELLRAVRADAALKHLPVLMVTAEAKKENIVEAAQAGASGYIVKPFTAATLDEKLNKIFQTMQKAGAA